MDMNELLRQHQIALINADNDHCGARDHDFRMVKHYARRIALLRTELGVPQY
jgi:hypothetical protein